MPTGGVISARACPSRTRVVGVRTTVVLISPPPPCGRPPGVPCRTEGGNTHMVATQSTPASTAAASPAANGTPATNGANGHAPAEVRPGPALPLLVPDARRLGGEFDVKEAARRVVRYETVTFH